MKKSVLALAALGAFAGAASAQSSVTMFGIVDLNVMSVDNGDRTYSMGTDGTWGHEDTNESVLSEIGRTIVPVLEPMGVSEENWPAAVGIFTGVLPVSALAVSAFFIGQDVTWPHMIGCALSIGSIALIGGPKPG